MLDPPDVIRRKFKRAVTDSGSEIRHDWKTKPGVSNLLEILHGVTGEPIAALEASYAGKGYGHLKIDTAEAVIAHLAPIQERHAELMADPAELDRLMAVGGGARAGDRRAGAGRREGPHGPAARRLTLRRVDLVAQARRELGDGGVVRPAGGGADGGDPCEAGFQRRSRPDVVGEQICVAARIPARGRSRARRRPPRCAARPGTTARRRRSGRVRCAA